MLAFLLCKVLTWSMKKPNWNNDCPNIYAVISSTSGILLFIDIIACISGFFGHYRSTITGFFNPEYGAAVEVLKLVGG